MDRETLHQAPAELRSPRLDLVFPGSACAAPLMESINASFDSLRFMRWADRPFDLGRAEKACRLEAQRVADGQSLVYMAFERDGGALVGTIDLHSFDFQVPRCQIGYVGDARRAGRGLMREAVLAVMTQGFLLGLERIEAWCDAQNLRSVHFAGCVGMRDEGLLRSVSRDARGALCDQRLLARLRGDPVPR
jgi:RimJ/RimL family protein N-acetyltransferase